MKNNIFNEKATQFNLFSPSEEDLLLTSSKIEITDEHLQVFKLLKLGTPVVYVSGRAGTGKTTLIGHLRDNTVRNLVVLAPTGVAAMNVKGVTINSFFQFPPRMITDEDIKILNRKLIQSISLLIIDEISMVRADTLDAIDKVLRKNLESSEPFGGIQVMLVGDMMQLPPVVTQKEWEMLRLMNYKSPYFFSAKVFDNCPVATQELTKIYRQSDPDFIALLNKLRNSEDLDIVLPVLNQRCVRVDDSSQPIITLTCTNKVADEINGTNLMKLPGDSLTFTGEITGLFMVEETKLPSPMHLYLKVGAQVMFTKNDIDKKWVNGTLGKVIELDLSSNTIKVQINDDFGTHIYDVSKAEWGSYRYTYDHQQECVVPEEIGSYHQYPLMLAWAVTVHKGQGKTLEKVKIDLGTGAFAHGQVYTAFSRCRTLQNIYLANPIKVGDVICDPLVKRFYAKLNKKNKINLRASK